MASADSVTNADSTANMEDLSRKYKRLEVNQKDWAAETEKEMKRLKCTPCFPQNTTRQTFF